MHFFALPFSTPGWSAYVEEVARVADLTKTHAVFVADTVFRGIVEALRRVENRVARLWQLPPPVQAPPRRDHTRLYTG